MAVAPMPVPRLLATDYPGAPSSPEDQCQHPTSREGGVCGRSAIGEFDIPPDYVPVRRHADMPLIPKPKARLCRQHSAKVLAHSTGTELDASGHEAQCPACQHLGISRVEELWVSWVLTTGEALRELGISQSSWYKHVEWKGLWDRKAAKANTKRALIQAAERGFMVGGDSAKTALTALQLLAKERGDTPDKMDVRVGVVDLRSLTDEELAQRAIDLATRARAQLRAPEEMEVQE